MGKMNVAVFEVGSLPKMKEIPNTLEALQDIVGGYIEMIRPFNESLILICNEEGKLMNLEPQLDLGKDIIHGNFLIARDNFDGEVTSLTDLDIKYLENILGVKLV